MLTVPLRLAECKFQCCQLGGADWFSVFSTDAAQQLFDALLNQRRSVVVQDGPNQLRVDFVSSTCDFLVDSTTRNFRVLYTPNIDTSAFLPELPADSAYVLAPQWQYFTPPPARWKCMGDDSVQQALTTGYSALHRTGTEPQLGPFTVDGSVVRWVTVKHMTALFSSDYRPLRIALLLKPTTAVSADLALQVQRAAVAARAAQRVNGVVVTGTGTEPAQLRRSRRLVVPPAASASAPSNPPAVAQMAAGHAAPDAILMAATPLSGVPYPSWFQNWQQGHHTSLADPKIPVEAGTPEFESVSRMLLSEFKQCGVAPEICEIYRIENHTRVTKYMLERALHKDRFLRPGGERLLFHGCASESVDRIARQGFDPRVVKRCVWGKGSYFASAARYSDHYSLAASDQMQNMFVSSVLVGDSVIGKSEYTRPPAKHPSRPDDLYDSCTDDHKPPTIYVTFDLDRAYPVYLLRYRMKPAWMQYQ